MATEAQNEDWAGPDAEPPRGTTALEDDVVAAHEPTAEEPDNERPTVPSGVVRVVVAHPDDETLWAGDTMLMHPAATWRVSTLCQATEPERAAGFRQALTLFGTSCGIAPQGASPDRRVHRELLIEMQRLVRRMSAAAGTLSDWVFSQLGRRPT